MSKTVIAYFSASGSTAKLAKTLAEAANGTLYEIRPAVPYERKDLNWMDKKSRSTLEMQDPDCRPALADTSAPTARADVIFLGFPIWWYREWNKEAVEMTPGTVVNIPANVKHWHGAAADSWFSHLAIEVGGENASNEWLEPVSEEDYNNLK